MQVTIDVPDDVAARLGSEGENLGDLLVRAVRQRWADDSLLGQEVLAFLARGPQAEEILAFHASDDANERARELLHKNREGTLTPEEEAELEEMAALSHFFIRLKAQAQRHLQAAGLYPPS